MPLCDYTREVGAEVLDPDVHFELMQQIYNPGILQEVEWKKSLAIDFFDAPISKTTLTSNLGLGQQMIIQYEKRQNPWANVAVSDVEYKNTETCTPQIDLSCASGCIGTAPAYDSCVVLFDKLYKVGASRCVRTQKFMRFDEFNRQYRRSLEDQKFVYATDRWNKLICEAIENPADTINPVDAQCFPTHYWQRQDAKLTGVEDVTKVISYITANFADSNWAIFAHRKFELDLLAPGSQLHNYSNTGIATAWANEDGLVQGGFHPMPALPRGLWGKPINIVDDSPYFYERNSSGVITANHNPFMGVREAEEEGEDDIPVYYVVFAHKNAYYTDIINLMDNATTPATCDNDWTESIQSEWLAASKLLFPEEVFILEYPIDC